MHGEQEVHQQSREDSVLTGSPGAEAPERLPLFLRQGLDSCPAAGDGVHFWIFRLARHLLVHFDERATFELLRAKAAGCGRPMRKLEAEIANQIRNASRRMWRPRNPAAFERRTGAKLRLSDIPLLLSPLSPPWPEPKIAQIRSIVGGGTGLANLADSSPIRFDDDTSYAEEIIDILFPGDPLLCLARSRSLFATRRREIWRGHLHRLPLIVPNPMLDVIGRTREGRWSEHTLQKTGRRTYLVIEFDFSEFGRDGHTPSRWAPLVREWREHGNTVADASAALLLHLSQRRPLVCVTHSGGKSLHGWFAAFGQPETKLRLFMEYAVRLGADHATWTRSQLVRIPDGLRENGRRQRCYYLDQTKALTL
jgi:hypothetical protein